MAKCGMFALILAVQSVGTLGAFAHQAQFRMESNLRVQSNTTMTFSRVILNNTISNLMQREIEMTRADPPKVNKIMYVLFAMAFGICGCDRCYMGQICLGCVKGFTFGGLLIWHVIDYFVCLVCALSKDKEISMAGYHATFEESSIEGAFWLSIFFLAMQVLQTFRQGQMAKAQMDLQKQMFQEIIQQQQAANTNTQEGAQQDGLDVPRRHHSLAYIPTALTRGLRKAGLVQEKPTIPELIAAFDKIDKNGDGQLDRDEIKEALSAMGASDEVVDEMIKCADSDSDGKISKNEFLINMTQKKE